MNNTECTCNDKRACAVRIARGLKPFCRMTTSSAAHDPNRFGSHAAACEAARRIGGRARHGGGGLGTGSPSWWYVDARG